MHSADMEDVNEVGAGEICAMFGVECNTGDTFCDPGVNSAMTSMFVPNPVISLAVTPTENKNSAKFSKALQRFKREDPTFRCTRIQRAARPSSAAWASFNFSKYTSKG